MKLNSDVKNEDAEVLSPKFVDDEGEHGSLFCRVNPNLPAFAVIKSKVVKSIVNGISMSTMVSRLMDFNR